MSEFYKVLYYLSFMPAFTFVGYIIHRYSLALRTRPKIAKEDILFQEWFASGASQKNVLTKLGGGRNCIRLVVTRDILWITSWFPFSVFAALYDMAHVIPLKSILSVQQKRFFGCASVLLSYADSLGTTHSLRLIPKNRDNFLSAIQIKTELPGTDRMG